jgi:hypothetical protein
MARLPPASSRRVLARLRDSAVNRFTHRKINFGSGLIRGDHAGFGPRKARAWRRLQSIQGARKLVPQTGLEPVTPSLRILWSTTIRVLSKRYGTGYFP